MKQPIRFPHMGSKVIPFPNENPYKYFSQPVECITNINLIYRKGKIINVVFETNLETVFSIYDLEHIQILEQGHVDMAESAQEFHEGGLYRVRQSIAERLKYAY